MLIRHHVGHRGWKLEYLLFRMYIDLTHRWSSILLVEDFVEKHNCQTCSITIQMKKLSHNNTLTKLVKLRSASCFYKTTINKFYKWIYFNELNNYITDENYQMSILHLFHSNKFDMLFICSNFKYEILIFQKHIIS